LVFRIFRPDSGAEGVKREEQRERALLRAPGPQVKTTKRQTKKQNGAAHCEPAPHHQVICGFYVLRFAFTAVVNDNPFVLVPNFA